jgi:hypothetical protein
MDMENYTEFIFKIKSNIMSKSKKPSASGAKYKVAQKVFLITYYKGLPEELLEGEVAAVITREYGVGKVSSLESAYSYQIETKDSIIEEEQDKVYPNFTEGAKVFAKAFLKPLK